MKSSSANARVFWAINSRRRANMRGTLALLTGFLLTGCAGLVTEKPPEEQVRERAQAWADALLNDDLQGAYELTSPNYRSFASVGAYHARVVGTGRWKSAEVTEVACKAEMCEVTFVLEYFARQVNVDVRRPRTYKWVKTDGQWWQYVAP